MSPPQLRSETEEEEWKLWGGESGVLAFLMSGEPYRPRVQQAAMGGQDTGLNEQ